MPFRIIVAEKSYIQTLPVEIFFIVQPEVFLGKKQGRY
jgi:hypothetical protein